MNVLLHGTAAALLLTLVSTAGAQSCEPDNPSDSLRVALLHSADDLYAQAFAGLDTPTEIEIDHLASMIAHADTVADRNDRAYASWKRLAGNLETLRHYVEQGGKIREIAHVRLTPPPALPSSGIQDDFPEFLDSLQNRGDIAYRATRQLALGLDRSLGAYREALRTYFADDFTVEFQRDVPPREQLDRFYGSYLAIKQDLARQDTGLTCYFSDAWEAWFVLQQETTSGCCGRWSKIRGWTAAAGGLAALTALGVLIHHHRSDRGRAQGALDVRIGLPR